MNIIDNIESQMDELITEMEKLCELEQLFIRWHASMSDLVKQNNSLKEKNNRLAEIARTTQFHALNARIVSGKASGDQGVAFQVVSKEITELSADSLNLSKSYQEHLNANELITVQTFQDIQAGGRVIITKIQQLLNRVKDIKSAFRRSEEFA